MLDWVAVLKWAGGLLSATGILHVVTMPILRFRTPAIEYADDVMPGSATGYKAWYVRIAVENCWFRTAKNVQAYIKDVRKDGNSILRATDDLAWFGNWSDRFECLTIPRGGRQIVDMCKMNILDKALQLQTASASAGVNTWMDEGEYELTVALRADGIAYGGTAVIRVMFMGEIDMLAIV